MASVIFGLLFRHLLTGAGGALVASGLANNADSTAIVGGATALVGVIASWWNKRKK